MENSPDDPNSFSRPLECITTNMDLVVDIDFSAQCVRGTVRYTCKKASAEADVLVLDTDEISIFRIYSDQTNESFDFKTHDAVKPFGSKLEVFLPPSLGDEHLPGDPTNYKVLVKNATTTMSVVQSIVDSHKEKLAENPEADAEDFMDHYLRHVKKGTTAYCTEKQLVAIVTDLVAMGIEATATTIRWGLLILGQNQEIQNLLQQEIDEVIGSSVPSMDHKKEMDQMRAFITELQRYINVVSVNLPHSTTADVTFKGYNIPKGTIVIPNLASVHGDENVFSNPMKFDISRHLTRRTYQRPTQFMPYSAGTRTCLGMQLSKMEIFMILTAVLQKYSIELSGEVGDDKYGLIRYPSDFNVVTTPVLKSTTTEI